jgi:hypothetical protein
MPLSDFFKKSPKKEPPKAPDDSLLSPEMQRKRQEAAREFVNALQEHFLAVEGKTHPGTMLSTTARLAGTSLYRSLNYKNNIPSGVVVLSNEVDDAWPQLMKQFAIYCKQSGFDVLAKPMVTKFPEQDQPRLKVEQVQTQFQDSYQEIMGRHGLDDLNAARAGMLGCAILFNHYCKVAKEIDPDVGTGIVAMGVVEGAKTAPPPLGLGNKMKKIVKNNNRLVLGEREAVIQEASIFGGVYIDPNPAVLESLKAGNIDPYLIHEKGMLAQIEKKIPRIDFVKVDVDAIFQEWNGKAEQQIPIHVRQLLWLKKHASEYGYVQEGNSWVLK